MLKKDKEIKCYLCGKDAVQYLSSDRSRDKVIECDKCGEYKLTSGVFNYLIDEVIGLYYRHSETGEKIPFSQEQKDNLSKYVQKNYDSEKREPVKIDMKRIKEETGKESAHLRYS